MAGQCQLIEPRERFHRKAIVGDIKKRLPTLGVGIALGVAIVTAAAAPAEAATAPSCAGKS